MGIFKAVGWFVTGGAIRPTTTRERSRMYQREANNLLADLGTSSPNDSRPRGACPACREMIIIGASTCPNCQTSDITWSEAENGGDIGRSLPAWFSPKDLALVREFERKERRRIEQLTSRRSRLSRRLSQKQHDKKLMRLHENTVKERGIKSVRELRSYLGEVEKSNREARERDAEVRMKAQAVQREREAELLRLEAERLRLKHASNLASKKMYDSIFDVLHGKVKLKLNPDIGESITRIELVEAFQNAGHRVNAATELIDEHRSAAWEQIEKLAQLLRDEAGWEVSAPTPTGP
jgi:hypothetical protein